MIKNGVTMAEWNWPGSRIARVVDGDSFDAVLTKNFQAMPGQHVDIGFGASITIPEKGRPPELGLGVALCVHMPVRLRLNRINAPKRKSPRGAAATAIVEALTAGALVDITTIKTYKFGGPDDMVGEYMAEVTLTSGDNLSDYMVDEGVAVYWDGEGPRPDDE